MTEQAEESGLNRKHSRNSSQMLAINLVLLCCLLFLASNAIPKFGEIFSSMSGLDSLPLLTACFVTIATPAYFLLFTAAIVGLVFADKAQSDAKKRYRMNLIVFGALVCFGILLVVAMFLPLLFLESPMAR